MAVRLPSERELMGNILVVIEHAEGKLRSSALSAIQFGLEAKKYYPGKFYLLLIGEDLAHAAEQAALYGADEVLTIENNNLAHYLAETYAPLVANVAKDTQASLIGGIATSLGKDLFPRVAGLLKVGMASDVSGFLAKKQFRRITHAGNLWQTVDLQTDSIVVTARQTEFHAATQVGKLSKQTTLPAPDIQSLGAEFVELRVQKRERPELTEAKIIVAGGRGLKEKQNFKSLEELCDILGAALGASRAACDAGLVPNDLQVGQTGKVVAPNLYIAIGISGAIQHLAGMKGSKVIVAVNKDPEAPIFKVADYGLVSTWEKALPEMIQALKK